MTSKSSEMMSSPNFLDDALFHSSSLVNAPSFLLISLLVLELWQFLFMTDWPEIQKSEIPRLSFAQYLETAQSKEHQNCARTSVIKCYWMLQNTRFTDLTVSELLRESQQEGRRVKMHPTPTMLELTIVPIFLLTCSLKPK